MGLAKQMLLDNNDQLGMDQMLISHLHHWNLSLVFLMYCILYRSSLGNRVQLEQSSLWFHSIDQVSKVYSLVSFLYLTHCYRYLFDRRQGLSYQLHNSIPLDSLRKYQMFPHQDSKTQQGIKNNLSMQYLGYSIL
jgi:hypothetical protein